jgi:hypothetical protein
VWLLVFLVNSVLVMLTVPDTDDQPATDRLRRTYFGMHRFEWPDDESVEFHLGHGDMIRLLRCCGFGVEDLVEFRPEPGATTRYSFVTSNGPGNGHAKKSGRPANRPEQARRPRYLKRRTERDAVMERQPDASTACAAEAPLPTCGLRPCRRP